MAASALTALEQRARARVLVSTRDLPAARALGRALGAQRVFEHVPAVAASITREQLAWLERLPSVRVVSLDEGGRGHLAEALPLAGFSSASADGWTGLGTTVAIIDSGIDRAHPDFAGALVDEACFCSSGCCPGGTTEAFGAGSAPDESGHGTHVAGIVASRGVATAIPGGAPAVHVIAIKVLDEHDAFCCMSDLVAALDWLVTNHPSVDVVNMSLGGNGLFAGDCDGELEAVPVASLVSTLTEGGSVVVASSGNNGNPNAMPAPACLSGVMSVGAVWDEDLGPEGILCSEPVTSPDRIACFSNASTSLDVLAPGAIVTSSWPAGLTRGRAGTSQAAPMVSACAALLKEAFPDAGVGELTDALRTSPTALLDERNGRTYPRLDCGAAIAALGASDAGIPDGAILDAEIDAEVAADDGGAIDAASIADGAFEGGSAVTDAAAEDAASASFDAGLMGTPDAALADAALDDGSTPLWDASDPQAMTDGGRDASSPGHSSPEADHLLGGGAANCACNTVGSRRSSLGDRAWGALALALAVAGRARRRR